MEGRMYKCRQCHNYIASETQRFNPQGNVDYNNGQADLFNSVKGAPTYLLLVMNCYCAVARRTWGGPG
ncbi:hypothetical protein LINGRAHAP2_LOCUS33187 [Linum grandiflorum]